MIIRQSWIHLHFHLEEVAQTAVSKKGGFLILLVEMFGDELKFGTD